MHFLRTSLHHPLAGKDHLPRLDFDKTNVLASAALLPPFLSDVNVFDSNRKTQ